MLSAGKYYIGNILNVLTEDDWNQLREDGEMLLNNDRKIAIYTTYDIDYCFWDLQGRCYVMNYDRIIGCIKVDDIQNADADLSKGQIIDFDEEFETGTDELDICFGRVVIQTESEEEEEYEDDEEIIEDEDDDYYEEDE